MTSTTETENGSEQTSDKEKDKRLRDVAGVVHQPPHQTKENDMAEYKREKNLIAVYDGEEFLGYAMTKDEAREIEREYEKERRED